MSTENSKSDEVNESLESMLNMDLGGDDFLGQSINFDLLDKEDGAEVGGNQSDTHLATEEGNREQMHSVTESPSLNCLQKPDHQSPYSLLTTS